jgi:hypothetical protein
MHHHGTMWLAALGLLAGISLGRQIERRRALEAEWRRENQEFLQRLREQRSPEPENPDEPH